MLWLVMLAAEVVPIGDPKRWLAAMEYPPAARRAAESGDVVYALTVTATGTVSGCAIVRSTAGPLLEAETCAALTASARFQPSGVVGSYRGVVRWALDDGLGQPDKPVLLAERALPAAFAGARLRISLSIDAGGKLTSCRIVRPSGRPQVDRDTCGRMERARWRAALDDKGEPVGYIWEREVEWVAL